MTSPTFQFTASTKVSVFVPGAAVTAKVLQVGVFGYPWSSK